MSEPHIPYGRQDVTDEDTAAVLKVLRSDWLTQGPGVPEFEAALKKRFSPKSLEGLSVSADGLNSDIHGSAEYRAHLIGVLARRAVAEAIGK